MPNPRSRIPMVWAGLSISFTLCSAADSLPRQQEMLGRIPARFEENRGQFPAVVRFLARGPGYAVALEERGEAYYVTRGGPPFHMRLAGVDRQPEILPENELPGHVNYYAGADPTGWYPSIRTFQRVRYRSVYPGIDLVFYGRNRAIEYDFAVAPGSSPAAIRLAFPDAEKIEALPGGDILVRNGEGEARLRKPELYQTRRDGSRRAISGRFRLLKNGLVALDVSRYDHRLLLVIDPVVTLSTFVGGAGNDTGYGLALDVAGNVVIAGDTYSVALSPSGSSLRASRDAFVMKLNSSGTGVLYATFLGGSQSDSARAVALDAAGNAYTAGITTSANFPVTPGAYQTRSGGLEDAFAVKLNSAGALVYSTYLGAAGSDNAVAIAVDGLGNAFVAGYTGSFLYPVTPGVVQTTYGGGPFDAFVTKLNSSGTAALYSTVIGGNGSDLAYGIAVDRAGNAYLGGYTDSPNFPVAGAMQSALNGISDGFVAKLSPGGSTLDFSTYLGGSSQDQVLAVALDSSQSLYATGSTGSIDFPATPGAFQTSNRGNFDAFVVKFTPSGGSLVYATYLGGGASEQGMAITVDATGNSYVAGFTLSPDFPLSGASQGAIHGSFDAFVATLNSAGNALSFSTYLGGSGDDRAYGIAIDSGTNILVTGATASSDFPVTSGKLQTTLGGGYDAFVTRFGSPPVAVSVSPGSGSGAAQVFSAIYSSSQGSTSLSQLYLLFDNVISFSVSCTARYDAQARLFWLSNDAGNGWLGPVAPGSGASVQNSRCILSGIGSTVSASANTLTVNYQIAFLPLFSGTWDIWLAATDVAGLTGGWQQLGVWTVTSQPSAVSVSPSSGTGMAQTFTTSSYSPKGAHSLSQIYLLLDNIISFSVSCTARYDVQANVFWLSNDAGNAWLGPLSPGASGSLQNSRCALSGGGSSVFLSGNIALVNFQLTFLPLFASTWDEWLLATDTGGLNSGWQQLGAWTVPSPPAAVSVNPNAGSGATETFRAVYSSNQGAGYLSQLYLLFDNVISFSVSCTARYDAQAHLFWLSNDAGNGWLGPLAPGSAGSVQNSRCILSGSGSTVSASNNALTVNYQIAFLPLFSGTWDMWLAATDVAGLTGGWQQVGAWTVTSQPSAVSLGPASGTGTAQTFTTSFYSPKGASALNQIYLLLDNIISFSVSCTARYDVQANVFWLSNDAGNAWLGPLSPRAVGSLQNSRCILSGTGSSASLSGNIATVNFQLTFLPLFASTWDVWLFGVDTAGLNTGWQQLGTWTVP